MPPLSIWKILGGINSNAEFWHIQPMTSMKALKAIQSEGKYGFFFVVSTCTVMSSKAALLAFREYIGKRKVK